MKNTIDFLLDQYDELENKDYWLYNVVGFYLPSNTLPKVLIDFSEHPFSFFTIKFLSFVDKPNKHGLYFYRFIVYLKRRCWYTADETTVMNQRAINFDFIQFRDDLAKLVGKVYILPQPLIGLSKEGFENHLRQHAYTTLKISNYAFNRYKL